MSIIIPGGTLKGILSSSGNLSGTVEVYSPYRENYSVTPKAGIQQVLKTANKLLTEDIIINPIPYYEVTNPSDGKTVYIAKED